MIRYLLAIQNFLERNFKLCFRFLFLLVRHPGVPRLKWSGDLVANDARELLAADLTHDNRRRLGQALGVSDSYGVVYGLGERQRRPRRPPLPRFLASETLVFDAYPLALPLLPADRIVDAHRRRSIARLRPLLSVQRVVD